MEETGHYTSTINEGKPTHNKISVTREGIDMLKSIVNPEESPFTAKINNMSNWGDASSTSKKVQNNRNISESKKSLSGSMNITQSNNSKMFITMYNTSKDSRMFRVSKSKPQNKKNISPKRVVDDDCSGSETPTYLHDSGYPTVPIKAPDFRSPLISKSQLSNGNGGAKQVRMNGLSLYPTMISTPSPMMRERDRSKSPTKLQSDYINAVVEAEMSQYPSANLGPVSFSLQNQIKDLKRKVVGSKYLADQTEKTGKDVKMFAKILDQNKSTHKLFNFLANHDYLSRASNPCKSKYTPLLNIHVDDFDYSNLDIDQKSLKNLVASRFGQVEKRMKSISTVLKRSQKHEDTLDNGSHNNIRYTHASTAFKLNDNYYSTMQYRKDKEPLDIQMRYIIDNFWKLDEKKTKSSVEQWRMKRSMFEESRNNSVKSTTGTGAFNSNSKDTRLHMTASSLDPFSRKKVKYSVPATLDV